MGYLGLSDRRRDTGHGGRGAGGVQEVQSSWTVTFARRQVKELRKRAFHWRGIWGNWYGKHLLEALIDHRIAYIPLRRFIGICGSCSAVLGLTSGRSAVQCSIMKLNQHIFTPSLDPLMCELEALNSHLSENRHYKMQQKIKHTPSLRCENISQKTRSDVVSGHGPRHRNRASQAPYCQATFSRCNHYVSAYSKTLHANYL